MAAKFHGLIVDRSELLHRQVEDIAQAAGKATDSVTALQGDVGSRLQLIASETEAAAGRAAAARQHPVR